MATNELDELLERMPNIAKAINAFTSETVQAEAFAALIAAFEGKKHSGHAVKHVGPEAVTIQESVPGPVPSPADANKDDGAGKSNGSQRKKRGAGSGKAEWSMVHTLNLKPDGKQSFEEFIEEKQPKSNEEKYVVALYYLSEILGVSPVTKNEVGTLFRLTKSWKEPSALVKGMQMTTLRKGTMNTSDAENITLTPQGRNFVDHDLPAKPKAKK